MKWNTFLVIEILRPFEWNFCQSINQSKSRRREEKFEFEFFFFHSYYFSFFLLGLSCFAIPLFQIEHERNSKSKGNWYREDWEEEKKVIICCCDCFRKCKREWRERNGEGKRLDFQRSMRDMNEVSASRVKRMILFEEKEKEKRRSRRKNEC